MDLSSEFLSSFLREDFPGSESCECQETTVRNEGDGRAAECPPNSLQWEDSAQQKYSRSGNSIHIPSEDEAFPERLGPQPPLSCTSEESKILEGTRQSSPRNSYFWTLLTDSSEEEHLDEAGESNRTHRKCVLGRNCRGFSGIALSLTSDSTLASRTMVLSGVPSPGEVPLQAEVRKECRGPEESHLRSPKGLTVKFKAGSSRGENSIKRLPGGPSISPSHSSNGRRKESDNVRFALGSLQTDIKHKNEWEHAIMERVEGTLTGRVPRGEPNRSMQTSTKSSLPMITRKQFDLTHPESYLDVSEGPLDNAAFHGSLGANVFHGPTANAHGAHGSAWFDQLPSTKMDSGSVQAPQVVTRQASHEQMEKTFPSTHPISRDVSKTGLKGSFPLQDGGDTLSWSDEQPHKPERGASVLETYFYYLHMLNKSRSLSSEERNSSLLFWEPGMCRSESIVTSPEGKGRSKVDSLDRKTKQWRDGGDSIAAMESERGTHPQGQGCAKQAAPEKTSFWKPQGIYGRLCSATPKMASRMTSDGGYQKMPDAAGSCHKHGDVKPRSKSIGRPSSAGAEKGVSPRTDPSAYTLGRWPSY
ncbi:uncharacterized protein LOC128312218 isoform X1 [Acinonyx jubatus]|uniref:Uncharacterized protein LOC128312218 isoform X1 n=1 Tax=Acinonyx jubatus TaxID=32536 RepID=A0ABM3NP41_ACIJB|nr:uncharacterized protein LOC128312218 isoform X1 [Acinonyx jubatus]